MALRVHFKKKIGGVPFQSGRVYNFHYRAWSNDPTPTIIFMYAFSGTHPNTGRQWRFIQGINFTYIPRPMRKAFAMDWVRGMQQSNGNVKFTYDMVKRRYPYLKIATRRYFYSPAYYISKVKEVPFENMEEAIISTWSKDFSRKVRLALAGKFRKAMSGAGRIRRFFGG